MRCALVALGSLWGVRLDALRASLQHSLTAVCDADATRLATVSYVDPSEFHG